MSTPAIIGIAVGTVLLAFVGYAYFTMQKIKNTPAVADSPEIKTLTGQNFDQQIKKGIVLVDFWAPWCGPCKMMAPVLNDLADATAGNSRVGKLNVDQNQEVAMRFNVRSIPTMVLFKDGREVNRFVGFKTKDFLNKEIEKIK